MPAPEPTRRMLVEENATLKSRVADLEAKIAEMTATVSDPAAAIEKALDVQRERFDASWQARENEHAAALDALRSECDARVAEASTRPVGEDRYVLITGLRHNGKHYAAGALCPFDPKSPPAGCDGLVEGVHYESARVIVRN
jgi:BMFP domain-containing protein YqiC